MENGNPPVCFLGILSPVGSIVPGLSKHMLISKELCWKIKPSSLPPHEACAEAKGKQKKHHSQ